jgi:hypothetical protein
VSVETDWLVKDKLRERWHALRDGQGNGEPHAFEAIVLFLRETELLDAEHAELWLRRAKTCPGHMDEGGRDWCAYCGQMPRESA